MKKILLAVLAGASAFAVSAQADVVKNAQNAMKSKSPDYQAVITSLKPAMTNPETEKDVDTWLLAGKASIGQYDNLFKRRAIGQEVDLSLMGHSLIDGINYYLVALPLDSLPDEKGKVKAKNSKEIIKQINENYRSLFDVAATLFNDVKDYEGSYEAFDLFLSLPSNQSLGVNAPQAAEDSIMGEIAGNKALAAYYAKNIPNALKSYRQAISLGYKPKILFDYAISMALEGNDDDAVIEFATLAYPLYGNEDPSYLQRLINGKIEEGKYDEANTMIDDAIAQNPSNGFLYFSKGVLDESAGNLDRAIENYKKGAEMVTDNATVQFNAGRAMLLKAQEVDESAPADKYNDVKENQIIPLYKEAVVYLEKAYEIDPDNMDQAARYLRSVYYYLNDGENFKRFEDF